MQQLIEKSADPILRRRLEQLQAELELEKARTDYIAMMADVELPDEEAGDPDVV